MKNDVAAEQCFTTASIFIDHSLEEDETYENKLSAAAVLHTLVENAKGRVQKEYKTKDKTVLKQISKQSTKAMLEEMKREFKRSVNSVKNAIDT